MRRLHRLTIALGFILALESLLAEAMTTRQRLSKFGDDLKEVVQNNLMPARQVVRQQLTQERNTEFTADMRTLEPPQGYTISKAVDNFLDSLDEGYHLFPGEKVKMEFNMYMKACTITFKQEYTRCADYAKPRTTQDCFELLLEILEAGMKRFGQERCKEARQEVTTAFNAMTNELMTKATVPEGVDITKQFTANVDKAHEHFPLTETSKDRNGPIAAMLEAAAKRVEQRAREALKKKGK